MTEKTNKKLPSINDYIRYRTEQNFIPVNASFELTYKCNERCIHCYIDFDDKRKEMTTDEVKRVLEELAELKTLQLTFTGGEVFFREDIKEILKYARMLKFNIVLSSNGTLIDESMADFLKEEVNPWEIGISIYGSNPEVHDSITRVKGSFVKSVNAIKYLKQRNVRVKAKIVIMSANYDDYGNMKQLAEDLDVKKLIDFNLTPRTDGCLSPLDLRITDKQIQDFMVNESVGLEIYRFDQEKYAKEFNRKRNNFLCKAGINFLHITPHGEVTPCLQWYHPVGDIRKNSLHDIWYNSEEFKKIRQLRFKDIEVCSNCEYLVYCNWCPGVAELVDGNPYGISSLSCAYVKNIKAVIARKYNKELTISSEKQ